MSSPPLYAGNPVVRKEKKSQRKDASKDCWELSGTLQKKSVFGHWKERQFYLAENGVLSYSAAENPKQIKATINLEECVVQNADVITNRPFSFGLFSPKLRQPILLLAKDLEQEQLWMNALKKYCHSADLHQLNIVETLEGISDSVVISNEKGIIISVNKAACSMFGYTKAETIGKSVNILMPETYRSLHNEFIQRYLSTGENKIIGRTRRLTGQKKSGTQFPIQLNLGEMSTPQGTRFIATIREVAERPTYKTKVVLDDTKKVLEEQIKAFTDTMQFEFNQLKDRIMELEEDRKKFKQKTTDLKYQLQIMTKWRALAEMKLSVEQKNQIRDELNKYNEASNVLKPGQQILTVTLPGEKCPKKKFDYLSKLQLEALWMWLPARIQMKEPFLIFTTEEDGRSLKTFFNKCEPFEPTLLLIKTMKDQVFGSYCALSWKRNHQFFGNGECFLFKLAPSMGKFGWTSSQPPYFMMGNDDELIVGGGTNGYGLRFDLEIGWSQACDTFRNEPLSDSPKDPFKIALVQVYGFK